MKDFQQKDLRDLNPPSGDKSKSNESELVKEVEPRSHEPLSCFLLDLHSYRKPLI